MPAVPILGAPESLDGRHSAIGRRDTARPKWNITRLAVAKKPDSKHGPDSRCIAQKFGPSHLPVVGSLKRMGILADLDPALRK
jgi:hypothetical protein